jgi:uncharacterized membrane protein YebE (DUF533 family)
MNRVTKNLGKLGAVVMIATGSLAYASGNSFQAANVYNASPTPETETDWQPIPAGSEVSCDEAPTLNCKAFRDANGQISNIQSGLAELH